MRVSETNFAPGGGGGVGFSTFCTRVSCRFRPFSIVLAARETDLCIFPQEKRPIPMFEFTMGKREEGAVLEAAGGVGQGRPYAVFQSGRSWREMDEVYALNRKGRTSRRLI